ASVIPNVSIVGPSTSTARDIFKDEMITMVDTLMAIRSTRPRTTSVVIHNVKKEPMRATPLPIVQSQNKGKATEQETKDATLIEQMEDVQARMDADELLAERIQHEEREQFTVNEQARIAQLRFKMVTYLKHIGKYTHNHLKSKSFKEIQMLYVREQKWINNFVPMDSKVVNDSEQQAESSKKISRAYHDKESVKIQKL
nr:hypothetical protein [Tanacetum cinerariifolium]